MRDKKFNRTPFQHNTPLYDLRLRAEEVLRGNPLDMAGLSAADLQFIVHELQVHQVELQLQNEELRRLQQELEISRDNFSSLYDFAPVCYCTLDQKGIIREANQMCSKMFGVENKNLIGQNLAHFVHPDDQDPYYLHHRHTLKNRVKQGGEMRVVGTDGVIHHVQIQSMFSGNSEVQIRVVLSDISAQKNIEQKLQESEANLIQRLHELNALHEATSTLQSTMDTDMLLPRMLKSILKAIPAAKIGLIYLVAQDIRQLHVSAFALSPDLNQETIPFSNRNRYVSKVLATKQRLLIPEIKVRSGNGSTGHPKVQKTRSVIIVPLITDERIYGAISLESTEKNAFSEVEADLLESFAATATAAIRNARLHEQLLEMAVTDFLTSVYNRQGFFQIGPVEFQRFLRYGHPLSLIELDVDNFKVVNDTYGHAAGDQVLIQLAQRLNGQLRKADIFCRYGGDEFVVLLPETNLAKAIKTAKRLNRAIEELPIQIGDRLLQVTISQGVCQATREMQDLHHLLKKADDALYRAKAAGRNRIYTSKTG